ncbi:MAG: hypothetical protein HY999_05575, partial [Nitrospinae bacterium]|nr:hypothetical protein [Nitrospinota bacterium]
MDLKRLEKLESYVIKMVNVVSDMKEKNRSLQALVDKTEEERKEKEGVIKENKELLNEREIIRSKIEDMLHALEKIEL